MTAEPAPEPTFDLDHYLEPSAGGRPGPRPDGRPPGDLGGHPGPDGKKFRSALWELDPAGRAAPRRLTRSAPGEANAAFLPDGSLLFTSAREDAEAAPDAKADGEVAGLWLLPAGGGEARPVASTPAGIDLLRVARDAGTVVYRTGVHPGADDLEADERREQGPHRRRGQRAAVRDLPDPLLGPLPGAAGAAAVRGRARRRPTSGWPRAGR
jgi:dipeptidyl aminopeptidase/acylaminoacyl peptidase